MEEKIEAGDRVVMKDGMTGVVVFAYEADAVVEYGPNVEREDGVYARRRSVKLVDLKIIKKNGETK